MVANKKESFAENNDAKAGVGHSENDIDAIIEDIYEAVGNNNKAAGGGTDNSATTHSDANSGGASSANSASKTKKSRASGSAQTKEGTDSETAPDFQSENEAEPIDGLGDKDPLAAAQSEADQFKERFVRLQAEWDNFRKRTAQERESERRRATANLVERLLPILDDMERAIEHSTSASENPLKEGISAVHNKMHDVLKKDGLVTIDPVGEAFDANIHQAVGKVDDDSVFDETVVQVYQKGYQMGDRVLRSAMVVVSQGGPKRPTEDKDQTDSK